MKVVDAVFAIIANIIAVPVAIVSAFFNALAVAVAG